MDRITSRAGREKERECVCDERDGHEIFNLHARAITEQWAYPFPLKNNRQDSSSSHHVQVVCMQVDLTSDR